MRRFSHYQDKPPIGYRLNPAHPLAGFVVEAWWLQEGGGSPTGMVTGLAIPFIGSPTWDQRGFITNASGAGCSVTATAAVKLATNCSICWQGRQIGTPAAQATIFGLPYDNAGGAPFWANMILWNGTKYVLAANLSGGSTVSVADATGVAVTGRQQVVGTINANNLTLYRNGIQRIQGSGTSSTVYAATSQIGFGSVTGNATTNPQHVHDFGILFKKTLSAVEVQLLWTDPYDLLEPIRPRSRSVSSGNRRRRIICTGEI